MRLQYRRPSKAVWLALPGLIPLFPSGAEAGPLVCTTSLEAPIVAIRPVGGELTIPGSPVEVTRCLPVETVPQLLDRRSYGWTSPYAQGVSLTNQITDILGIAVGGVDSSRLMGLGFPDQTLVWDGLAIRHTADALLEQQSNPMPQRTPDLVSVFSSSLGVAHGLSQPPSLQEGGMPSVYVSPVGQDGSSVRRPRGLW